MSINWIPLSGQWLFEEKKITFLEPQNKELPFGIALSSQTSRNGSFTTNITLTNALKSSGRILFGYNAGNHSYFSAGLGGYNYAFLIDEYIDGRGWQGLALKSTNENLQANTSYLVNINIFGQNVILKINNIKVIQKILPHPLLGDQIGLFAWGNDKVIFENTNSESSNPRAFVIMQFTEPYNSLFADVIKPVSESMGFEIIRADNIYKPGIILNDIIQEIVESDIIIGEITPENANVFYELGYAHALEKTTILLAEKDKKLPFDIAGRRCIFYDNTIKGKSEVEENLKKHLESIKRER